MLHVSLKFTRLEHGYFIKIWNNDYFTRTLWHDLSSLSKDYRINGALSQMRERGEGRKRLNSFRNTYHTNAVWNLWYQKLQSAWEICRDQIYLLNSLQRPPWEFHSFSVRTKVYRVRARVGVRWIPQDPLWKRQTFIYYNMKVISNSRNKQLPDERLHPYTRWRCTRTLASLALIQSLHNYVLMIAPNLIACGFFFWGGIVLHTCVASVFYFSKDNINLVIKFCFCRWVIFKPHTTLRFCLTYRNIT